MPNVTEKFPLTSDAQVVRDMAIKKMAELEQIRQERKNAKELLKSELEADSEYVAAMAALKEAKDKVKQAKARLMQHKAVAEMTLKVDEFNAEYNETKKDISSFLISFNELTRQKTFEVYGGEEIEIIKSARAKRRKLKG